MFRFIIIIGFVSIAGLLGRPDSANASTRHVHYRHSAAARYLTARFAARHGRPFLSRGATLDIPPVETPPSDALVQTGRASFYGGGRTANGGRVGGATCAHRTLPFGTRVLVTNLANARQAVLTVNDRGPFVRGRIVDVSIGAAGTLGMLHAGTAPVSVKVIGPS